MKRSKLTLKEAKRVCKAWGMSLTKREDEYRVNFIGGKEATASYHTDLDDAVGTAYHMSHNKDLSPTRNPRKKRVHKMRRAKGVANLKSRHSVQEFRKGKWVTLRAFATREEAESYKDLVYVGKKLRIHLTKRKDPKRNPFGKRTVAPKGFAIQAIAGTRTAIKYFYWTGGDRFSDNKTLAHKFGTKDAALKMARSMLGKLPMKVRSLRVIET